jgi:hypothetical protein
VKIIILISIVSLLAFTSCKKDNLTPNSNGGIEIYLLKAYTKEINSSRIINESIVLDDSALINDSEIYSYNMSTFTFQISAAKAQWLNDFQTNKTHGRAFAVTVDKTIIYTGYFWASFSSSSVDWIVIDPLNYSRQNTLTVRLGYPGLFPQMVIPDLRNDPRLIELLRITNRLILR